MNADELPAVPRAIAAIQTFLRLINARRRVRLLDLSDIVRANVPESKIVFVRPTANVPGTATIAMMFRFESNRYALIRASHSARKNPFPDLAWNGEWKKGIEIESLVNTEALWVPDRDDLLVYSDYLEEQGKDRIL